MSDSKPMPYAVIRCDPVANKHATRDEGFVVIMLRACQLRNGDNEELMVADYRDPNDLPAMPEVSEGSCTIRFNGVPVVRAGSSPKPFYAILFDANGNSIVQSSPFEWELILPPELNLNQMIVLFKEGNEIRIQASSSAPIGTVFTLRMSGHDTTYGNFSATLEVTIGGIL